MKKLIFCALILTTPCFALKEYYSISQSIRALGMGGAFYGLSDDESALFYNPAGLAVYKGSGQSMLSINLHAANATLSALKTVGDLKSGSQLQDIVKRVEEFQGNPLYGNFNLFPYYLRKHFAIGLLIADTKANVALLGRDLDSSVDLTVISDTGLIAGYADTVADGLHLGFNAKALVRAGGRRVFNAVDIAQSSQLKLDPNTLGGAGAGIDFDVGAIYDLPDFGWAPLIESRASVTINNLLGSPFSMARQYGPPPALPRTFTLGGVATLQGWGPIDNVRALLDLAEFGIGGQPDPDLGGRTGDSFLKHVNLGVELPMSWFTLRAGLHQGDWTLGFGVNVKYLEINLASYGVEDYSGAGRLTSRRVALQLKLGVGSAPPPPVAVGQPLERQQNTPVPVAPPAQPSPSEPLPPVPNVEKQPVAPPAPGTQSSAPATSPVPTGGPAPASVPEQESTTEEGENR